MRVDNFTSLSNISSVVQHSVNVGASGRVTYRLSVTIETSEGDCVAGGSVSFS